MKGLGDKPVDQTRRPYGTAEVNQGHLQLESLTSSFTLELQPVRSNSSNLAIPLDLDSITLEFALCIFPQVAISGSVRRVILVRDEDLRIK